MLCRLCRENKEGGWRHRKAEEEVKQRKNLLWHRLLLRDPIMPSAELCKLKNYKYHDLDMRQVLNWTFHFNGKKVYNNVTSGCIRTGVRGIVVNT